MFGKKKSKFISKSSKSKIKSKYKLKKSKYKSNNKKYKVLTNYSNSKARVSAFSVELKSSKDNYNMMAKNLNKIVGSADVKRKVNGEIDIVETKRKMQQDLLHHLSIELAGCSHEEKVSILKEYRKMFSFISNNNNINNYIRDYT